MTRRRLGFAAGAALAVALLVVPAAVGMESYRLQQLDYILAAVMVTIGLNVVTGFAGQLSLGPGAVFAVGGYTAAVLANRFPGHVGLGLMCLAGLAVSAILGFIIGIPALRIGGFYLGMMTLFFALIVPIVVSNLDLTGGSTGISLLSNPDFTQTISGLPLYLLSAVVVLALIALSWALLESRVGHRFVTLAASEELASSLGIAGYRTKLLSFVLSALPAGLGGAFYAYTQQFISPGSIDATLSIYLLAAAVIGGFGTVLGPLVGGLLILGLSQFLTGFQQYQGIVFGVLLVVFSVALPEGIVGVRLRERFRAVDTPWRQALRVPFLAATAQASHAEKPMTQSAEPEREAPEPPRTANVEGLLSTGRPAVLVAAGVRRSFGGVRAVDGVDLRLEPGTLHGLIGSNGSGKTTLLNLVSGFYSLDAGAITLDEERIDRLGPHRVAAAGIARTFQTPKLLDRASVLDNVVVAAEAAVPCSGVASVVRLPAGRRAAASARDRATAALEATGLAEHADEPAGEQPHGTRRLVEVARTIAQGPRIVLLDEPAAGLSPTELSVLRSVIQALVGGGAGVLLIEHNVPFVLALAQEITAMHEGRVLAHGDPNTVSRDRAVADAFLGSRRRQPSPDRPEASP
jgi:ABC-type branched-subunit amino acid transport system ATPase component/ABC-type branched-subunit amino acid transport system permease subunit